jgi:ribonucleotide monophosphatase NagD (HAD superfamily)
MIGDRIDTDMAGAARVGLTTVLTLSGIATADDVASSWIKPDLVCEDLASLLDLWEPALP